MKTPKAIAPRRPAYAALVPVLGLMLAAAAIHPASATGRLPGHGASAGLVGDDGGPGKASEADRTIKVEASEMAFNLKAINVRAGETVRFVVTNVGEIPHEFVIASKEEKVEHRKEMSEMTDMSEMSKPDPNAVMVEPKETKELVWRFGRAAALEFACDLPGHAEAGMTGSFTVMR